MPPETSRSVGKSLLGPVFYRFLVRLYFAQAAYDPADTYVLFLARGGIRLRRLYQEFLAANGLASPLVFDDFYVSRMSVIKASLLDHYEAVYEDLAREYPTHTVDEFVERFLGDVCHARWTEVAEEELRSEPVTLESLQRTVWGPDEAADLVRRELHDQSHRYAEYLVRIVGSRTRVLVVDTGWSGSILHYMRTADPAREYTALFFGRHSYGRPTPPWYPHVVGLVVEAERFSPRQPETALLSYRHLVEGTCEIRIPSVTGYDRAPTGAVEPVGGPALEEQVLPGPDEELAAGILDYVRASPDGLDLSAVERSARHATKVLWRRLMYPRRRDVELFAIPTRSADFGKDLDVPVLLPRHRGRSLRSKRANVRRSLWPAGQAAVEFPNTRLVSQLTLHHGEEPQRVLRRARRDADRVLRRLRRSWSR